MVMMIRSNVFGGIINLSRIHQKIVYRSCCTKSNEIVGLSHVDEIKNVPRMVDITRKITTSRQAHAQAIVKLSHAIIEKLNITNNKDGPGREIVGTKGPVFATAIVAGVMAAKRTSELIPFCHQVPLDKCDIDIELISSDVTSDAKSSNDSRSGRIKIDCFVSTSGKTGVEMEAIIGASMAAICIYDMLKALSHDIEIIDTYLVSKSGGKSTYQRQS